MILDRLIYIYSLSDPETNEVRYIGRTIESPHRRYLKHISQSKNNTKKDYCHCWIKSLIKKNLKPHLNIIEETFDTNREIYWIDYYRDKVRLTNINPGGDLAGLGTKRTKDQIENIKNGLLKNSKIEIYELDDDFNIIKIWKSYGAIATYIGSTMGHCHTSIKRFSKINGVSFVLKSKYDLFKSCMNNYGIFVTDILSNKTTRYKNFKDFRMDFNCSHKIIENYANKNKIYSNKYIIKTKKRINLSKYEHSLSK